ncbi:hypothetical protein OESDEN_05377 [Oesophagostomum dentatum]|uniref:Uncharacterized protein n=1 Tax=Oesophagostomum dentatum TaxID=61180 RepID=A0A0B1TF29_OESDE|nr:hypothetical protein OESDEN_05377 [Oesophagostomum dentatum]
MHKYACYCIQKDLHSSYSPSPTPSPLSAHFKRAEQSTSRSESPSSRVTVTLPRKEAKPLKSTPTKNKVGSVADVDTPSTSPMPKLENQSAAESVIPTPLGIPSARNSPIPKPPSQRSVAEPEAAVALQSIIMAQVKEEVKKEKKQREKKVKQKDKHKKQQEEQEMLRKQEEAAREQERLAQERLEKERAEQQQAEERARLRLLELARDTATPPMRQEVPEASPRSLKIVISNPHSDSASSAFSPPPQVTQGLTELRVPGATPATDPQYDNDSDTVPFFDDAAIPPPPSEEPKPLVTTFPPTVDLHDSSSQHHKKKKKKDKVLSYSSVSF